MNANRRDSGATGPRVRILLGEATELELGGTPIRLSPIQQAYVLLLANGGQKGMHRDQIIRLLWDEGDTRATRHRVRQRSLIQQVA